MFKPPACFDSIGHVKLQMKSAGMAHMYDHIRFIIKIKLVGQTSKIKMHEGMSWHIIVLTTLLQGCVHPKKV